MGPYRQVERLEETEAIDTVADPAQELLADLLPPGPLKDALSGTWLGHPLHPLLIAGPIGFWTSATLLDLVGGRKSRKAATRPVGLGVLAALPTAASGAPDWADTTGASKRVGLVHAAFNYAAVGAFFGSWRARRKGHHGRGVLLALVGDGCIAVSGYLGGHLSYSRGVGVDQTVFDPGPADWTPLDDVDTRILVTGEGAIHAVCTHRGGPLDQGRQEGGCVECPWHGSRFRLADGDVVRGPATQPQARFEVREVGGRVEVRRAVPSP
jgi:nitrite reductase/ring-hydroxylating ferredoxin subunit/uncharacterized membrane protein